MLGCSSSPQRIDVADLPLLLFRGSEGFTDTDTVSVRIDTELEEEGKQQDATVYFSWLGFLYIIFGGWHNYSITAEVRGPRACAGMFIFEFNSRCVFSVKYWPRYDTTLCLSLFWYFLTSSTKPTTSKSLVSRSLDNCLYRNGPLNSLKYIRIGSYYSASSHTL